MKRCMLLATLSALIFLLLMSSALGEDLTVCRFFPEASYRHFSCGAPERAVTFDAAFYEDGYFFGADQNLQQIDGYYAILPDESLMLTSGGDTWLLIAGADGGYAGDQSSDASCTLTPIPQEAFDALVEKAELFIEPDCSRMDVCQWDYPVYWKVVRAEGMTLFLTPDQTELITGRLPEGTVVLALGETEDACLVEANGIRGFVCWNEEDFEDLPVMRAKVVRAAKEKGRSVNLRSTPDYGDNVIDEVPYGEYVDVFPVVEGEFTRVFYDYRSGWMTTIRLEIVGEAYGD